MDGADRFVISTRGYAGAWTVETCLTHLNARGFHHFEVTATPGFLWPGDMDAAGAAHFRRFLAGHRLRIVALRMPGEAPDIAAPDGAVRAAAVDEIERLIGLGGDIGAQGVAVGLPAQLPAGSSGAADVLVRAIERLSLAAASCGTALWLETTHRAAEAGGNANLMQLLDRLGDSGIGIGIVHDLGYAWGIPDAPDAASAAQLRTTLLGFAARLKLVRLRVGTSARVPAATGLPALLAEIGYADWPVLDIGDAAVDVSYDVKLAAAIARLTAFGLGALPAQFGRL